MLPKGDCGKQYIKETTRLINEWLTDSPIKECALYAVLKLQKVKTVNALNRRIEQWKNGQFLQLLREVKPLQNHLPKIAKKKSINVISRKVREHVSKGNVNSVIKLLSNNMKGGVLPLNDETIELLKLKHPEGRKANEDVVL